MKNNISFPQIALLGTSADPPTIGHKALLIFLSNYFSKLAIWASDNPMKNHSASLSVRVELLSALVEEISDSRIELVQDLSSPYALASIKKAYRFWPNSELVFVIGSDLAGQIPKWKDYKQIFNYCRLAIVPRQGWPIQNHILDQMRNLGGKLDILNCTVLASASSKLRKSPTPEYVPMSVWPLLIKHNLYGLKETQN